MEFLAGNRIRGLNSERVSSAQTTSWQNVSFNASSAVGGATTSGNTATGGTHWTQYVRSNEYISPSTGGGEIYFTQSASGNASIGYEKSPFNSAPTAVYTGKDYSFHTTSASNNMYEHTADYAGTAWASSTNEFRITMDSNGLVIYYWRSGNSGSWTTERTSTVTASGDYYMAVSPMSGTITCFIKGNTVATNALPNIEDGSIFYETDNNKSYVLYNGSWTEL